LVLVTLAISIALAADAASDSTAPFDINACRNDAKQLGPLDVAIAIDSSMSTRRPSGADTDGDGVVGRFERSQNTDPGDSVLALEVAAVRALLNATAESDIRYSVISFSGVPRNPQNRPPKRILRPGEAELVSGLTDDVARTDAALTRVLESGSSGNSNFAAGMRRAVQSLRAEPSAPERRARRLVLFLSDSARPTITDQDRKIAIVDPIMQDVAIIAIEQRIAFNTFGLSLASVADPPHPLEQIAGATGGRFTPVTQPNRLHCELLSSLGSPTVNASTK
jgi:hypothetical protein